MTEDEAINAGCDELPRSQGLTLARAATAAVAFAIALDVVPAGGIGSAARVTGLAFAGVALWRVLVVRHIRPLPPAILLMTGFTAWAALSLAWVRVSEPAVDRMTSYAQLLLFLWLGWQVVRTSRDWRALAGGYVAGCAVAAVASWMESFAGVSSTGAEYDPRYAAFGFDPNDMGVTLAIAIPLAVYLGVAAGFVWRLAWFLYVPLAVSATVLTGSRGGSITTAIAVAAAIYIGLGSGARLAVPLGGLITAGVAVAAQWIPPATWQRIVTLRVELAGGTLSDRAPIWRTGLAVFADHPLVGVGAAGFPDAVVPELSRAIVAHNTPLSLAVEHGVVGLALFLGAFVAALGKSRASRSARAIVPALVITWFVGVTSLTWEYRKTTWLVLLLAAAAASLEDVPAEGDA